MQSGKLLLLPNLLDETQAPALFLPPALAQVVASLHGLIAESEKSARRYLRHFVSHDQMAKLPLRLLNEHTPPEELASLLAPAIKGEVWGVISDAGLPCIADPGAELVRLAHQKGVAVQTFAGPCSLLMALQLSGFSGQRFAFHGYLPREIPDLERKILELEKRAAEATQIWIEAPYRSAKMLEALLKLLQPKTELSVAASLTFPNERALSMPVEKWRSFPFRLEKEPVIFLLAQVLAKKT